MASKNTRAQIVRMFILRVLADFLGSNWLLRKPMVIKPCWLLENQGKHYTRCVDAD
jgi:hypothetical protein